MSEIDELRSRVIQLEAELTVVTFERDQLQAERDAVRVYFGGTRVGDVIEQHADPTGAGLSDEEKVIVGVRRIVAAYPDKKIQAIKELRDSDEIAQAWYALGGSGLSQHISATTGQPSWYFGLKEAKDIIDAAFTGYIYLPRKGRVQL